MKYKFVVERMTTEVPVVPLSSTIADAESLLRSKVFETINYLYVVDDAGKLVGVMSIKEIFRASKTALVEDLMRRDVVSVHERAHQESVARLAIRHNLKAIPVVDKDARFLGVVPSDVILNILHEEHIEDLLRFSGIREPKNLGRALITAPVVTQVRARLPWLIVGTLGGIAAALIVGMFENALRELLVLAAFIPAVVYIADAVGTQVETLFIRSLAMDQNLNVGRYMKREVTVGAYLGFLIGVVVSIVAAFGWGSRLLGMVLGVSFFIAIIAAAGIALLLPWLFVRAKVDPAIASGPFATIITDILSLAIYFGVASLFLGIFE